MSLNDSLKEIRELNAKDMEEADYNINEYSESDLVQELESYRGWINTVIRELWQRGYRIDIETRAINQLGHEFPYSTVNFRVYKEIVLNYKGGLE